VQPTAARVQLQAMQPLTTPLQQSTLVSSTVQQHQCSMRDRNCEQHRRSTARWRPSTVLQHAHAPLLSNWMCMHAQNWPAAHHCRRHSRQ
jgi:hypothetical protein